MNLLSMLEEDRIQLKKVSGTNGGEYAGPCPACGGTDRFRVWPEQGELGKWWCRQCGKGGDAVQYLREMREMTFHGACEVLGIEAGKKRHVRHPPKRSRDRQRESRWQPRETGEPVDSWQKKAGVLIAWAQERLWSEQYRKPFEWLKQQRGLTDETIRTFHLGWNPKDLWRVRAAWGLSEERKENGQAKGLWLPAGLIIPCLHDGKAQRVRIRRHDPSQGPRYYTLPGSSMGPRIIIGRNQRSVAVVESDLDALLLHQEASDLVSIVALGSAQIRPDRKTTEFLNGASIILLALDYDDAGTKEARLWWPEHFRAARRFPPALGKDIGEMFLAGVRVRDWVLAGLETDQELGKCQVKQPDAQPPSSQYEDLFVFLQRDITTCGPYLKLWPQVRRYVSSQLPRDMFMRLEHDYQAALG